jgi:hypothetical protein
MHVIPAKNLSTMILPQFATTIKTLTTAAAAAVLACLAIDLQGV